jgi:cell division protein FtsL
MDAFYTIVMVAFASLSVVTLFNHLVRINEAKETITELREGIDKEEERIAVIQTELKDLRFDSEILDDERVAVEKQTECMLKVEEKYTRHLERTEGRE